MKRITLCTALALALAGCATPPEVRQLSTAQTENFNLAIRAATLQGEVIVELAEQVADQADKRHQQTLTYRKQAMLDELAKLTSQADTVVSRETLTAVFDQLLNQSQTATERNSHYQTQISELRTRAKLLKRYLVQMKQAQQVLDGYLQSEQMGEAVLTRVTGHGSISSLQKKLQRLSGKVADSTLQLDNTLKLIAAGGN